MENKQPNHLIYEKSPYLLQHAYNPVNWYPWNKKAFDKAKKEDKPIFLSIGYSTCHWCHVMKKESFEDMQVAKLLNKYFISIKVDKEERPDIDTVYMKACQAITGQGGWPMTIIMTPNQRPFFTATYLPKTRRYNTIGLIELLNEVVKLWNTDRIKLIKTGDEVTSYLLNESETHKDKYQPTIKLLHTAKTIFLKNFDKKNGGFGSAPKFPTPHNILFLMRYAILEQDKESIEMVEKTLRQMFCGGIFDHIGFGFSRYSTDEKWLIPHFEKMLYDNALLCLTYLEAYQLLKNNFYRMAAEKIMTYVLRELTSSKGGFYCAQDADSDDIEGKYYIFTPNEIKTILGTKNGDLFNQYLDITPKGNFNGMSIPNLLKNKVLIQHNNKFELLCEKVYQYRKTRTELHIDDKILTSWNALMIVAFTKAYRILGETYYLDIAQQAEKFIQSHLTKNEGKLYLYYRNGQSIGSGNIDDYAFYSWALLELYNATFEIHYLEKAVYLTEQMIEQFYDEKNSGFYFYNKDSEQLISRPKELYDGAIPSGNSVAAYILCRLAKLTGESRLEEISNQQLQFISSNIKDYPAGYSFSLIALICNLYPSKELICTVRDKNQIKMIKDIIYEKFLINTTILIKTPKNAISLEGIAPFTKDYPISKEHLSFYLCENGTCSAPFSDLNELKNKL